LRGVFHAAGALDDAMLENQRWSRFETVFAPKLAGSWRLHVATRDLPLDYFVMFSSLASVLGSPSQANYAAANAFLDALAHHRRQLGLPALSVNWGPWAGAGMAAASAGEQERRASRGVAPLDPAVALAALEQLLASDACQITVANVEWGKLAAVTAGAFSPEFAKDVLPRQAGSPRSDARPELRQQLEAVPADRRRNVLLTHVQAEVAHVVGVDELAAAQSQLTFMEMGMNSLMVVELRNNLEATVGCKVPATVIFNYPTIDGLADYIGRELGVAVPEPSAPSVAADDAQAAAAARIAQLSDSEVETLLLRTLEDIK
jgi:acyl carrier protein